MLDFNFNPPHVSYYFGPFDMYVTNASICNSVGKLLCYTNGTQVANGIFDVMADCDSLNLGEVNEDFFNSGYPLIQGAMMLPSNFNDSVFAILHVREEWGNGVIGEHTSGLFYTLIDMRLNGANGGVLEQRVPILLDTLDIGNMVSVRHSNGIDWWIIVKEYNSNRFYKVLFSLNGEVSVSSQEVGQIPFNLGGIGAFSPNGKKYAEFSGFSLLAGKDVEVFDFNRCTGKLSNPILFHFDDGNNVAGLVFSPSSRFLYLTSGRYIYQYDMEADDIIASKDTVAIYDGSMHPFPATFFTPQLGPDGKIYIISPNGNTTLHVIHYPDLKGDACMVEQNAIQLPTYNRYSMPHFPNYRLGAIPPITPSFIHTVSNDTVYFQSTSLGGSEFKWNFGDGGTGMGTEVSHVYSHPGNYVVTLKVIDDCLAEAVMDTIVVTYSNVKEIAQNGIQVQPNPATDFVNFYLPASIVEAELRLRTVAGQTVLAQRIGFGWSMVGLEGIAPGLYFYEVKDSGRLLGSGKLVRVE